MTHRIRLQWIESGFMKRMTDKVKSLVGEHGIRNCTINYIPRKSLLIIGASWKEGTVGLEFDKSVYQGKSRILQLKQA